MAYMRLDSRLWATLLLKAVVGPVGATATKSAVGSSGRVTTAVLMGCMLMITMARSQRATEPFP